MALDELKRKTEEKLNQAKESIDNLDINDLKNKAKESIDNIDKDSLMNEAKTTKGNWSWYGFLFAPHYYAGYGDIKKGSIYAALSGIPIFGLVIAFLGGKNAKKDLPIGEQEFKWTNVGITVAINFVALMIVQLLIFGTSEIDSVKNGVMNFNKTITLGEALDNWDDCESSSWTSFETSNKTKIVEFTCSKKDVKEMGEKVFSFVKTDKEKAKIFLSLESVTQKFQFTINKDDTFQIDNVQREIVWSDGKKFSIQNKPLNELEKAYNNEISYDLNKLDKKTAYGLGYAFMMLWSKAK